MDEAITAVRVFQGLSIVLILVAGWFGLQPYLRARRMEAVRTAKLAVDQCLACDSQDVRPVAEAVVRCQACGFVGGEGAAAWQREVRRSKLEKLPPEARRRLALDNLHQADLQLGLAQTSLDQAAGASYVDIAGLSFDRGEEKQNALAAALKHMQAAHVFATEAVDAMHLDARVDEPMDLEQSGLLRSLDAAWLTDGVFPDLAMHLKIRKARKQLVEMQRAVGELVRMD